MKYRIIVAVGLLLAAALAWLAWRLVQAPAVDTSDIVEAPTGHAYQFISAPDQPGRQTARLPPDCPGMAMPATSPLSIMPRNTSS